MKKKKIGITLKNKRVSELTLQKYGPVIVYFYFSYSYENMVEFF